MMAFTEWLENSDDPEFEEAAFYVIDNQGIVAGPFDTADEGDWWLSKAKRVA